MGSPGWPPPPQQPYQPSGPWQGHPQTGPPQAGWAPQYAPYPQPPYQQPQYQPPRAPGGRKWLWISAAAILVIAVAATATVFFIGGTSGSDVADGRPTWTGANDEGRTNGTYPNEPESTWSVSLRDVEEASGEDLDDLTFEYPANYGDVLLTSVGEYEEDDRALLVAIDAKSGDILWTSPSEGLQTYRCSRTVIDRKLVCTHDLTDEPHGGAREVRFYDIDTGELVATESPDGLHDTDVRDGAVYTGGVVDGTAWVARGTVDDLEATWRVEYPAGSCSLDDWMYASEDSKFVSFGGVLLDGENGEQFNDSTTSATRLNSDERIAVASPATSCSDPHEYAVKDASGATLWTHPPTEDYISGGADDDSTYYLGATAYDIDTGEELWSASGDMSIDYKIGSTLLATDRRSTDDYDDDVTVGLDPEDGSVKWRLDDSSSCYPNDGERCISDFYESGSEIKAFNLETGEYDWTVDDVDDVTPAGDGFVTSTDKRLKYYPPNG